MKKLLKVVLVLMLAFGIQIATLSNVDAAQVSDLPDGKYTIPTKLKNARALNVVGSPLKATL